MSRKSSVLSELEGTKDSTVQSRAISRAIFLSIGYVSKQQGRRC